MDNIKKLSRTESILTYKGHITATQTATICNTSEAHVQNIWLKEDVRIKRQAERKRNIND